MRPCRSPLGTYWRSLRRVERRAAAVHYTPRCPHCRALLREAVRLTNRLYWRATELPTAIVGVTISAL